MMAKFPCSVYGIPLLLALLSLCSARQHYRARFPNGVAVPCPPDHDCAGGICEGVGHLSCLGGAVEPRRNPFGQDFEDAGLRWTKELCEKDSDGDGFTNGEELGDPCCVWHEGATVPSWMTSDEWEVTHPGFESSKPDKPMNIENTCANINMLETGSFYNEGEEQVVIEYVINENVIPPQETTYDNIRFNFPDDREYHIVGVEPLVENEEMVHHFIVMGCSTKTDTPGVVSKFQAMNVDCEENLYGWAPGLKNFSAPKNAGFRVGNGSNVGFELEIHYDNPLLKEGQTDASGIRVFLTPDLRPDDIGVLWVGSILSVGLIPPGETDVYSSTICQVKIDEEVAPGGMQVFGFAPHMHLLGRRLWTDRLVRSDKDMKNGSTVMDINQLEKIGEIGRDDLWDFDVQYLGHITPTRLRDGDYLSTTCVYDSRDREDYTTGGLGSYEEMCINFLYYYPAEATEDRLFCSGPRYFGTALPRSYSSFLDISSASAEGTQLPMWRQAYLSGELTCDPTGYDSLGFARRRLPSFHVEMGQKCGKAAVAIMATSNEAAVEHWSCSQECAKFLYNHLGCALMEDAFGKDGTVYSLIASPMEIIVESYCKEQFLEFYEDEKATTSESGA